MGSIADEFRPFKSKRAIKIVIWIQTILFALLALAHLARFVQTRARGHVLLAISALASAVYIGMLLTSHNLFYLGTLSMAILFSFPLVYTALWATSMKWVLGRRPARMIRIFLYSWLSLFLVLLMLCLIPLLNYKRMRAYDMHVVPTMTTAMLTIAGTGLLVVFPLLIWCLTRVRRASVTGHRVKTMQAIRLLVVTVLLALTFIPRFMDATPFTSLLYIILYTVLLFPRDAIRGYLDPPEVCEARALSHSHLNDTLPIAVPAAAMSAVAVGSAVAGAKSNAYDTASYIQPPPPTAIVQHEEKLIRLDFPLQSPLTMKFSEIAAGDSPPLRRDSLPAEPSTRPTMPMPEPRSRYSYQSMISASNTPTPRAPSPLATAQKLAMPAVTDSSTRADLSTARRVSQEMIVSVQAPSDTSDAASIDTHMGEVAMGAATTTTAAATGQTTNASATSNVEVVAVAVAVEEPRVSMLTPSVLIHETAMAAAKHTATETRTTSATAASTTTTTTTNSSSVRGTAGTATQSMVVEELTAEYAAAAESTTQ